MKPRTVRPDVQEKIFDLVRMVPAGEVASYGMIASLLPGVTARMVGHAMRGASDTAEGGTVPWQRIINASGGVSAHGGSELQRNLLRKEGIKLTPAGKVRWRDCRWQGPVGFWLEEKGIDMLDLQDIMADWPR